MRPLTGSTPLGRLALLGAVVPLALLGAACDAADDASPGQETPADESEGNDGGY